MIQMPLNKKKIMNNPCFNKIDIKKIESHEINLSQVYKQQVMHLVLSKQHVL